MSLKYLKLLTPFLFVSFLFLYPNKGLAFTVCTEENNTCGAGGECGEHEVCKAGTQYPGAVANFVCVEDSTACPYSSCPTECRAPTSGINKCGAGYIETNNTCSDPGKVCCEVNPNIDGDCKPTGGPRGECGEVAGCLEGQVCVIGLPSHPQWICESDTGGVCGVNNCSGGATCVSSCPLNRISTTMSCGQSGIYCCVNEEEPCAYSCLTGLLGCPSGYAFSPGYCETGRCCYEQPDPQDGETPHDLLYSGPIITSLADLINPVAKVLYYAGLFIGVFFIVYSGYRLMVSQGDPQQAKDAQEQLTAAILGIMFILLAKAIVTVIINLIGL